MSDHLTAAVAPGSAPPSAPARAAPVSAGVRRITLDAAGVLLSALLSEPAEDPPRATVLALHGGGMNAGYFDGQADPGVSLMTLGAALGYTVLAVDRPGYGSSAAQLPRGLPLAEQSSLLRAAVAAFAARHPVGEGVLVLAHSFGGKAALSVAADGPCSGARLLGLDISGCGLHLAAVPGADTAQNWRRNWGPLRHYPPGSFNAAQSVVEPMPAREAAELGRWPEVLPGIAPRVRVPVRLTFAEHEEWWRTGERELAGLAALLGAAPEVRVERQPRAGHNISLGYAARPYHLRALAFLEDCLARTDEA